MYFMIGNLIWRRNENNVGREMLKIKFEKKIGDYEFIECLLNNSLNGFCFICLK